MLIRCFRTGQLRVHHRALPLQCLTAIGTFAQGNRVGAFPQPFEQHQSIVSNAYAQPKLLVVHPKQKSAALLQEALRLAESYTGTACPHISAGPAKHHSITPSTYFGPGIVKNIEDSCTAYEPIKVFVNAALTPVQQRNLELAVGVPVLDRVGLIIDIFAQRARTREARLQVELAALEYRSSRLVRVLDSATGQRMGFGEGGSTEVVSARERGRSGSSSGGLGGAGGGGQSELQLQRQRLIARRKALQRKLSEVQRTREVQRAGRRRSGKPVLAVVGYTNAGKSSLLQALTKTDTGVEDRLFATLDPALRRVHLPSGREAILSDTVGFISDLPHQLVNAFKATLEEVCEADLLVHVLDASSPHVQQQRTAVLQVLRDLGISEARLQNSMLEVWNKTDLLSSGAAAEVESEASAASPEILQTGMSSKVSATNSSLTPTASSNLGSAAQQPLVSGTSTVQQAQAASATDPAEKAADPAEAALQEDVATPSQTDSKADQDSLASLVADDQHGQNNPQQLSEQHRSQQQHSEQQQQQHASQSGTRATNPRHALSTGPGLQHKDSTSGIDEGGKAAAVFTSAATGAGLQQLLLQIERKISVKCAARELADGTARLGPRLLTNTVVGPPSKHHRPKWRGLGEWESVLRQSLRDQSTTSSTDVLWTPELPAHTSDVKHWAAEIMKAHKK